jgi:prepilin-type processing-associated H-X9-DG protein
MYGPVPDQPYEAIAYWQMFGSAHAEGISAAFADGSVRGVSYQIANAVFQLLCRKDDGQLIDATAL